jgi:hypothetical protein
MVAPVTDSEPQACADCRFWRRGGANGRDENWGECRRMPPTLPQVDDDKLIHVGLWPHTAADDWCGEWEAASI